MNKTMELCDIKNGGKVLLLTTDLFVDQRNFFDDGLILGAKFFAM